MNITAKELGNAIGVSDKNARGLVMYLEEAGCVAHIGSRKNDGASRGKPANDYSIDSEACEIVLQKLMNCLCEISSKEKEIMPPQTAAVGTIAPPMIDATIETVDDMENEVMSSLNDDLPFVKDYDSDDLPSMDELPDFGDDSIDELKYTVNDF